MHRWTKLARAVLVVTLIALVAACDKKAPNAGNATADKPPVLPPVASAPNPSVTRAPNPEPKRDARREAEATPAPPASPPLNAEAAPALPPGHGPQAEAGPGPAWLFVANTGVVKLDAGKFEIVVRDPKRFRDVAVDARGDLWFTSFGGVWRLSKDELTKVGDFRSPGSLDRIAVAPDGSLWGVSFKGVAHYEDGAWTSIEKAKLGDGVSLLKDIVVDRRGRVWVLSTNDVHVFDGGAWKTLDSRGAARYGKAFYNRLAEGPNGRIYATLSGGVVRFDDLSPKPMNTAMRTTALRMIAVSPTGEIILPTLHDVLILRERGGVSRISPGPKTYQAKRMKALAVDLSGRFWLATDNGVVVRKPDGEITQWLPGSVPALAGEVEAIAVIGEGPALPSVGPVATGAVTGKLVKDGDPVVGATVEICTSPSMMFKKTPCHDSPFHQSAETDERGVFLFKDVPLSGYRFAIRRDGKWSATLSTCCETMRQGQVFDVGSINLEK